MPEKYQPFLQQMPNVHLDLQLFDAKGKNYPKQFFQHMVGLSRWFSFYGIKTGKKNYQLNKSELKNP